MKKKIKILGHKWTVNFVKKPTVEMERLEAWGLCNRDTRTIHVATNVSTNSSDILAHELIHAYMFEVGLDELNDERHVVLIENMFLNIVGVYNELKI